MPSPIFRSDATVAHPVVTAVPSEPGRSTDIDFQVEAATYAQALEVPLSSRNPDVAVIRCLSNGSCRVTVNAYDGTRVTV